MSDRQSSSAVFSLVLLAPASYRVPALRVRLTRDDAVRLAGQLPDTGPAGSILSMVEAALALGAGDVGARPV